MTRPATSASALFLALAILTPVAAQTGLPGFGQRPPLGNIGKLPDDWHPGEFDLRTGKWLAKTARHIKWVVPLGSQTFGSPVVAGRRVFVGTNNGAGYLSRYSKTTDLGCLLCFRETDGEFLWQHSSEKLPSGRVHDLGMQGIQCSPWIEGERAWFVTNRGEVICLDTQGFSDDEDDGVQFEESSVLGVRNEEKATAIAALDQQQMIDSIGSFVADRWPIKLEDCRIDVVRPGQAWRIAKRTNPTEPGLVVKVDFWGLRIVREKARPDLHEADVVWQLNMMEKFGSQQHNNSVCCVTVWKNALFVCTGNGVDEGHINIPAPEAPSFVALDKSSGQVLWTSNLPGKNIHHGNWSSPVVGVLGGVPQVIFNGGDGWTYAFHAEAWHDGQPQLLWKFDTNSKDATYILGGRGARNEPIAPPVLYSGRVFITTGQDAEHGEGPGCIWCLDPNKRGDVSAELVVRTDDPTTIVPYDRRQVVQSAKGQVAIPNPNSAVIWKYVGVDRNTNGEVEFHEQMHRTLAPVVIEGDLLFASDFAGIFHCLDVSTGQPHWTYDALATIWCPPLVADGKVYLADEDGDVAIFLASAAARTAAGKPDSRQEAHLPIQPVREINMPNSIYTQPTASQDVLFIAEKSYLFAIQRKP